MSAPLSDEALVARGWREVEGGWARADRDNCLSRQIAIWYQSREDRISSERYGSVRYYATAEQKRSPILSALDGKALERDVIAELAERVDALETELCRALEASGSKPAMTLEGMLFAAWDEARRATTTALSTGNEDRARLIALAASGLAKVLADVQREANAKVVVREIRDPDAAHASVDLGDGVRREIVIEEDPFYDRTDR